MSDEFVTKKQIGAWFEELEESLKQAIVTSPLIEKEEREADYRLYQAAQLLKVRFYSDFPSVDIREVQPILNQYDPD